MQISNIDNVVIEFLKVEDYESLKEVMISSYPTMPDMYWRKQQIETLVKKFPEGQVVIRINDKIAACALSILIDQSKFNAAHTYREITDNYSFSSDIGSGDVLYGIDVFVHPEFRGLRLGRRMYDYRKEMAENKNLKSIIFGGRIPNYHAVSHELTPKEYIQKVKNREIHDPVLNFQLANDFHPVKVIKGYLEGDNASNEYAVLMEWDNIYYEEKTNKPSPNKKIVRIGVVQWQMRPYKDLEELMNQVEYFIDALSGYRADFALFPEFFNAPLMADYNHLSGSEAIRELSKYTEEIVQQMSTLSVSYNINIITGSMPELVGDQLYNVGYLCKRDGTKERYEKIHVTPDEAKVWGMIGGKSVKTFDTDCGKIGVLICYDSEFPELSRMLADEGMEILFVPFLTDTQNGFYRVKCCSQARAIENECYVAIAGSVGNLPKVHNMDIQFAHSMIFTPCDFAFPTNGVKAETTPNTEMILLADVDTDLLKELHRFGSVRNLRDRRKDVYEVVRQS